MNWNEVWMKNCWRRGDTLIPLATVEGKCDFDPAGISPPSSIMVVFETFDGVLHYGETALLGNAGPEKRCTVVFLECVVHKKQVYFQEYVKGWAMRTNARETSFVPTMQVRAWSSRVTFTTRDRVLHHGEFMLLQDMGKNNASTWVCFDRIAGVPRVYFAEDLLSAITDNTNYMTQL